MEKMCGAAVVYFAYSPLVFRAPVDLLSAGASGFRSSKKRRVVIASLGTSRPPGQLSRAERKLSDCGIRQKEFWDDLRRELERVGESYES